MPVILTRPGSTEISEGADISRFVFNEHPSTVSGTQVFALQNNPVSGTVQLYVNGLLQEPGGGKDYLISGSTVTFTVALEVDDILLASYIKQV